MPKECILQEQKQVACTVVLCEAHWQRYPIFVSKSFLNMQELWYIQEAHLMFNLMSYCNVSQSEKAFQEIKDFIEPSLVVKSIYKLSKLPVRQSIFLLSNISLFIWKNQLKYSIDDKKLTWGKNRYF